MVATVQAKVATGQANRSAVPLPSGALEGWAPSRPRPLAENDLCRMRRCRHGWMLYLRSDVYIGRSLDLYGEYSEGEITLFRQLLKPGQTVLEVGANIGAHTVFLARAVGPSGAVHAIEAQRVLHQILCANAALNGLVNVYAHHAAAGRHGGRVVVPRIDYSRPGNFGGVALGAATEGEEVSLVTVDSLALDTCDFIKIDVEGMESEVIGGAERTIRRHRPLLYLENDRAENSTALIQQLFDLDYRLYWHFPPLFNPDNYFQARQNEFGEIISINMLGVPRESPLTMNRFREITDAENSWRDG